MEILKRLFAAAKQQRKILLCLIAAPVLSYGAASALVPPRAFIGRTCFEVDLPDLGDPADAPAPTTHLRGANLTLETPAWVVRTSPIGGAMEILSVSATREAAHLACRRALEALQTGLKAVERRSVAMAVAFRRARQVAEERELKILESVSERGSAREALSLSTRRALVRKAADTAGAEAEALAALPPGEALSRRVRLGSLESVKAGCPSGSFPPFGIVVAWIAFAAIVTGLVHRLDRRIGTAADALERLRTPVLGVVPTFVAPNQGSSRPPIEGDTLRAFEPLAQAVADACRDRGLRCIAVASAIEGEGRSLVSAGLAMALSARGLQTVLVDTAFDRPRLHKEAGIVNDGGVRELLDARARSPELDPGASAEIDTLIAKYTVAVPGRDNLKVLPAGICLGALPPDHCARDRLRPVLLKLARTADVVVCDSSSLIATEAARAVASSADAAVLVIRCASTEGDDVALARQLLREARAPLLGVILNASTERYAPLPPELDAPALAEPAAGIDRQGNRIAEKVATS